MEIFILNFFFEIRHVTAHACNLRVAPYFETEFHKVERVLYSEMVT